MHYISERYSKYFFILSCVLFFGGIWCFHQYDHDIGVVLVVVSGINLYTLAYPFFYKIVRGYYPNGYYAPIEEVMSLSANDLLCKRTGELQKYASIHSKNMMYATDNKEEIKRLFNKGVASYRNVITGLAWVSLNSRNSERSIAALSFLSIWKSELTKLIKEQYTDSQTPKEYEMEIE